MSGDNNQGDRSSMVGCIRDSNNNATLCGSEYKPFFQSAEHAAIYIKQRMQIQPCNACLGISECRALTNDSSINPDLLAKLVPWWDSIRKLHQSMKACVVPTGFIIWAYFNYSLKILSAETEELESMIAIWKAGYASGQSDR